MHLHRLLRSSVFSILLFLGIAQSVAISPTPATPALEFDKRVIYHDNTPHARYFLNSFASLQRWGVGSTVYSVGVVYHHAISLLSQMQREQPQTSTLGFHLGHLDLSFATTTGEPIPWETALYFMHVLLGFMQKNFVGPEFQAFVTDIALEVTIEVSLRLLLDGPLPRLHDNGQW